MKFIYDDGGRAAAGFRGETNDCVCRAIAIASERPYQMVYDELSARMPRGSARHAVPKLISREYLKELGWHFTPTMGIGSGCRVHLRAEELPAGRLIVSVSKHMVAVIDGAIYDTHDPSRGETRCVYGYWTR